MGPPYPQVSLIRSVYLPGSTSEVLCVKTVSRSAIFFLVMGVGILRSDVPVTFTFSAILERFSIVFGLEPTPKLSFWGLGTLLFKSLEM